MQAWLKLYQKFLIILSVARDIIKNRRSSRIFYEFRHIDKIKDLTWGSKMKNIYDRKQKIGAATMSSIVYVSLYNEILIFATR